jgi:hypothetical protein
MPYINKRCFWRKRIHNQRAKLLYDQPRCERNLAVIQGKKKTVIASQAFAKISMRLVTKIGKKLRNYSKNILKVFTKWQPLK